MEKSKFLCLIDEIIKMNISDLHLSGDTTPYIRNHIGNIVSVEKYGVMSNDDID